MEKILSHHDDPASLGLSTFRIETLADGIFAIAMTLLIFDIKIPEGEGLLLSKQILLLIPNYISFVVSFCLLGIYWIGLRFQFHFIKRVDLNFHWLEIFLLASVALVPFSTSLLARNYMEVAAIIFYGCNLALISMMMYFQWKYATNNFRLVEHDIPKFIIRFVTYRILFSPLGYLIAIICSFINPFISLCIFVIVPAIYIIPLFKNFWNWLAKEK